MARRRGTTISVTTDVEIDPWDVLEELNDEEILEEVERRDLNKKVEARRKLADPLDLLEDALDALRRGDSAEAVFILERTLHPKFPSIEVCEKKFSERG